MHRSPLRRAQLLLAATVTLALGSVALTAGAASADPQVPQAGQAVAAALRTLNLSATSAAARAQEAAAEARASAAKSQATAAQAQEAAAKARSSAEQARKAAATEAHQARAKAPRRAKAKAQAAQAEPKRIYELTTPTGGNFLTTDPAERASAIADHGFTPVASNLGAVLTELPEGADQADYIQLNRLRAYDPANKSSYLLTSSAKERDELLKYAENHPGEGKGYVDDGIFGYAYKTRVAGTALFWRVTKQGVWKIARTDDTVGPLGQGYSLDGPLGYLHTGDPGD